MELLKYTAMDARKSSANAKLFASVPEREHRAMRSSYLPLVYSAANRHPRKRGAP